MTLPQIIFTLIAGLFTVGLAAFAIVSLQERHRRAARLSALFALLSLLLLALFWIAPPPFQTAAAVILGIGVLLILALFFWPFTREIPPSPPPQRIVDERTILFARARLQPGMPEYESYYAAHPVHQSLDDAFRQNPGLLTPGSAFYDPLLAASPEGGFFLTESLRTAVDIPVSQQQVSHPPEHFTHFIKNLALYHGASDVGMRTLQPYHLYTHIGRGTGEYGAPIQLSHTFAIALTVEMSHEMINSAPRMPAVMESARQYAESAKIAVILAAAIRSLGYPARAHIDGNYRVIAPLVARDAGLGEIGRMGLLMTPRLGPRVRLAVVTTDMPLAADAPAWNPAVIDFCSVCNKCAAVCPAQAIPFGERTVQEDGTLRWKLNAERCYTYWTRVGTDCGRCMAVCPYAHADTLLHNLIRLGVQRSGLFRRAAVLMDDLFYGKKPMPHAPPGWVRDR